MKTDAVIVTERQRIRGWADTQADRAFYHRVNSDDTMLQFFPQRWSREEADAKFDLMRARNSEHGFGWAIVENRDTGQPYGFVGLAKIRETKVIGADVEIGWRYVPEVWGRGLASEAARALLVHGFEDIDLDEIVAFAAKANAASIAVMKRIGMTARPERDFDMPGIADGMAHLRRHVLWDIRAADPSG